MIGFEISPSRGNRHPMKHESTVQGAGLAGRSRGTGSCPGIGGWLQASACRTYRSADHYRRSGQDQRRRRAGRPEHPGERGQRRGHPERNRHGRGLPGACRKRQRHGRGGQDGGEQSHRPAGAAGIRRSGGAAVAGRGSAGRASRARQAPTAAIGIGIGHATSSLAPPRSRRSRSRRPQPAPPPAASNASPCTAQAGGQGGYAARRNDDSHPHHGDARLARPRRPTMYFMAPWPAIWAPRA